MQQERDALRKYAEENLKGNLKKLTPTIAVDVIGWESYDALCKELAPELTTSLHLTNHCIVNGIKEQPRCHCGNPLEFNHSTKQFALNCSVKCRAISPEWNEKRMATNTKKYGHANVFASEYGKQKLLETNMEKYGVSNYTKTQEYKDSVKDKKLPAEHRQKIKKSHLIRGHEIVLENNPGFTPEFTLDEYIGIAGRKEYPWTCNTCGRSFLMPKFNARIVKCDYCAPVGTKYENYCGQVLSDKGLDVKWRTRKQLPTKKELDVFVPSLKFGIETCGLYHHSDKWRGYSPKQHLAKLEECTTMGIKLFTIFDDEMDDPIKKRIVMNRIFREVDKIPRKISAEKCSCKEVDPDTALVFLDKYFLDGPMDGIYYGLYYRNRLVAISIFKEYEKAWEFIGFCSVFNFVIEEAGEKLFAFFLSEHQPSIVYSYVDRRWERGELQYALGFEFVRNTPPRYFYVADNVTRLPASAFKEPKKGGDWELPRTWDCGDKYFVWTPPTELDLETELD